MADAILSRKHIRNASYSRQVSEQATSGLGKGKRCGRPAFGLKEFGEFLGPHEPIARFLSKKLNACGRILTEIEAPVPSQIEHLPK